MKLAQLTRKYPVLASLVLLVTLTILTEAPVDALRGLFAPLVGRFYGDYLGDLILNAMGVVCLLLIAKSSGMAGKLGLIRPKPWSSVLLMWPLLALAFLSGTEYLSGDFELVFNPLLLVIFIFLYLFIGFFEELLFRGFIQGFIERKWGNSYRGILLSVLVANLIFGSAHLTNLIMGRATPLYAAGQFVFTFFFGIFFSALYVRSGSLVPGIALHWIYNFVVNLDAFSPDALPRSEIVRSSSPEGFLVGFLITLPLFISGLVYLRRSKVEIPFAKHPLLSRDTQVGAA